MLPVGATTAPKKSFFVQKQNFPISKQQVSTKLFTTNRNCVGNAMGIIVIVITFYSPSCLGQETAKGSFGLRVKLPPAHLSTTHGGGFTLSLLMLNVKQESCEYQFL